MNRFSHICVLAASTLLVVSQLDAAVLTLNVVDDATGQPIASRVYLQANSGEWHFFEAPGAQRYEKQNWNNKNSVEYHTCLLPGPATVELPSGIYHLTVERGKEYFPATDRIEVGDTAAEVTIRLKRWINMAKCGYFSGEMHLHRTLEELNTVVLAEDLNVAFPLTYWETRAGAPPSSGNKNIGGEIPDELITIDPTHVVWPRNTEYEIFTVGEKRHTLGALFLLNHKSVLQRGVPPWGPIAEQARDEGAFFDMDKLAWPFSATLPVTVPGAMYELSNNHVWRTEFGFRQWTTPAAPYLQPPFGGTQGNERDWLLYTLGMYYTLLNSGEKVMPIAGTANGVHPVPAGFSRVYVKLDGEFSYEKWLEGLRAGRSFVTTGPMLFAKLNHQDAGSTVELPSESVLRLSFTVVSEQPVTFCELIYNGIPKVTLMGRNSKKLPDGSFEMQVEIPVQLAESGWVALRVWENRPDGRFRFAHTAPWWIDVEGSTLALRPEEKEYLIDRVQDEIDRSQDVLGEEALAEYHAALESWKSRDVRPDASNSQLRSASDAALRDWLNNMVTYHRFTPAEVQKVLGLSSEEQAAALKRLSIDGDQKAEFSEERLTVLPYPGGRHPRTGFLDGALDPQRDTKFSVFLPWDRPEFDPAGSRSYVVVDLPEAIFTNLGLTYLAHTHVPTIWSEADTALPQLEWNVTDTGLEMERILPNGIRFGATVTPGADVVDMDLWLTNGTKDPLTNMRVQNCIMLQGAKGFHDQTNSNKVLQAPFVAVHDESGDYWMITAWTPNHRAWANPPCPCMHSDPVFPDCPPGETVHARGKLWFYRGTDIEAKLKSLSVE
ncbi:MAG: CehA/McbA family metallohydrolase [Planctomycetaceae bacterium]|nr:CehA/McbA family metallohydrolase [Planctomycetaceae bacterium]MCB9949698.1 CehA/McbA family metallohydrolase [Planctomycetaceae bacterium]